MCSRKCWLLTATGLLGLALLGAIVSPWYIAVASHEYENGDKDAAVLIFYWHGVFLQASAGPKSISQQVAYTKFEGDKIRDIYITCNVMAILAFCMAAAAPFVLHLLLHRSKSSFVVSFSKRRIILGGYYILLLIFTILSWTIFFAWPGALNKSLICTDPASFFYNGSVLF